MIMILLLAAIFIFTPIARASNDSPFLTGIKDSVDFAKQQEDHLIQAKTTLTKLLAVKEKHTIENTLTLYDEILI
jgi:hypothetical protein